MSNAYRRLKNLSQDKIEKKFVSPSKSIPVSRSRKQFSENRTIKIASRNQNWSQYIMIFVFILILILILYFTLS